MDPVTPAAMPRLNYLLSCPKPYFLFSWIACVFLSMVCTRDAEPVEHGFAEVSCFFESSQVAASEGRSH